MQPNGGESAKHTAREKQKQRRLAAEMEGVLGAAIDKRRQHLLDNIE